MSKISENNKRIAKNTMFLYIRQLITLFISLYTVRVLLIALGTDDYGIYNVVGGVVTMFGFLSSTMATSTQRFMSYELGKQNEFHLNKIFSISINIYVIISLIVLILLESIGLWFLNNHMVIPEDRLIAANFVFQSAVLSFLVTILCTPYNAAIISNEDMNIFALVGLADAVLKLLIVLLLQYSSFSDNLIVYSILTFLVVLVSNGYYVFYCRRKYNFCRYKKYVDNVVFKSMLSFAGWNIIGSFSNVLRSQGINVLINIFFGPAVNAARAIAYQINNAIISFSNNFYTAVRPQITKGYASNNKDQMEYLIDISSRASFYLMLLFMIPISLNAEKILSLWLHDVPAFANIFLQLALLNALFEVYSMPLVTGIQATGKIKAYQLVVSVLYLFNLPLSYIFLHFGYPPQTTVIINIVLVILSIIPRMYLARRSYHMNVQRYLSSVLLRTIMIGLLCYSLCYLSCSLYSINNGFIGLVTSCIIMCIITIVIILIFGITRNERIKIFYLFISKIKIK